MHLLGSPSDPPSLAEAQELLAVLIAAGPARVGMLLDQVQLLTGTRPVPTVAGAGQAAEAIVPALTRPAPPGLDLGARPPWFTRTVQDLTSWSDYGAALADGFMHFIATVYRTQLGAHWVLNTDPTHAYYHQPVMSARLATPPQRFLTMLYRVASGQVPAAKVTDTLTYILATARADRTSPGASDRVGTSVSPLPHDPQFTHEVFIDETAEVILGTAQYTRIGPLLRALPGVTDVVQEDREVYLLHAPGAPTADLALAVQDLGPCPRILDTGLG